MSLCASVYMCFVVTCWERADLLALVCGVFCEFVTFPLVSWVRCGTWLYRFLIFAPFLTFRFNLICNMTTFIKKCFDLLTQSQGPRVCWRLRGTLCSIPFLTCNMTTFRKKSFDSFDPTPGAEGVYKDKICVCMVLYAPFPWMWYATRLLSEKIKWFDRFIPSQWLRVCVRTEYVLAWCYMFHSL